ncbi:MAG: MBOAT family protein [Planctomycetales bacterium]
MDAFLPRDSTTVARVALLLAALVGTAFLLSRLPARPWNRLPAWIAVFAGVILADRLTLAEPAGFRMLALIAAPLLALKGVVSVESRLAGRTPLGLFAWWAFALGWFGMRPALFAAVPGPARPGAVAHLRKGTAFVSLGASLALAVRAWITYGDSAGAAAPRLAGIASMMLAFSLIVHFGLCDMQAGLWRSLGADCRSLFRAPLRSTGLKEFWGGRWNVAFSEMTALAVFRPLRSVLGERMAATTAFLFSGLLHETAISLPVRAGFGLPLLYFALHALAMRLEARFFVRAFARRPWLGRLWTLAWLALPLPLLFHPPFVNGVIAPLLPKSGS